MEAGVIPARTRHCDGEAGGSRHWRGETPERRRWWAPEARRPLRPQADKPLERGGSYEYEENLGGAAARCVSSLGWPWRRQRWRARRFPRSSVRVEGKTKDAAPGGRRSSQARVDPRYGAPSTPAPPIPSRAPRGGHEGVGGKAPGTPATASTSYRDPRVRPRAGQDYWECSVGHVAASLVLRARPAAGRARAVRGVPSTGKGELPTGITGPTGGAKLGVPFTGTWCSTTPRASPPAERGDGQGRRSHGHDQPPRAMPTLVATKTGKLVLTASHKAEIRSERSSRC